MAGCVLGALLACAAEIGRMTVDRNKHVVDPGRVYRSAQLNPDELERFVREHNIRTVINLRGRPFSDWYPAQAQATQALGISQEDVTTSANRLPSPGELRRLIEIFDQTEHPILIHCQQGADRTGLAAAAYLLLYTDADYATALPPVLAAIRPRADPHRRVDGRLLRPVRGLAEGPSGPTHTPANFRHWATTEYCPGPGRADWNCSVPTGRGRGRPAAGIHGPGLQYQSRSVALAGRHAGRGPRPRTLVQGPDGDDRCSPSWPACSTQTSRPAGSSIRRCRSRARRSPGRYRLYVDLTQRNVAFAQYGSEPLIYDWEARDPAPPRDR